jgi:hypothetical protein
MPIGPALEPRFTCPATVPVAADVTPLDQTHGPKTAPAGSSPSGPSPFAKLVGGLGHEVAGGEGAMRAAVAAAHTGADLGPAELIALQAGVYRYSEAIDLASRLVDSATSGVKTVIQGQ